VVVTLDAGGGDSPISSFSAGLAGTILGGGLPILLRILSNPKHASAKDAKGAGGAFGIGLAVLVFIGREPVILVALPVCLLAVFWASRRLGATGVPYGLGDCATGLGEDSRLKGETGPVIFTALLTGARLLAASRDAAGEPLPPMELLPPAPKRALLALAGAACPGLAPSCGICRCPLWSKLLILSMSYINFNQNWRDW
jgi:hypothetical protein